MRATNHLQATLDTLWPGALAAFPTLDTQIASQFLHRYPTPDSAAHLGIKRLEGFLDRCGYGNRYRDAVVILEVLKSAPSVVSGTTFSLGCEATVLSQVEALDGLTKAIKDLDKAIGSQLNAHPDSIVFQSLPHAGVINAAQMLAEWGDCRQAYETADAVSALAGMSPVTRQSGKHQAVLFRWACNKWFRTAMTTFADNSRTAVLGHKTSTSEPWIVAETMHMQFAFLVAPGSELSGDAGSTAVNMTSNNTLERKNSPLSLPS